MTQRKRVARAAKLYEDFTGHEPQYIENVRVDVPDVMMLVGELDGVLYSVVRDGRLESYIHEFSKQSRPLLCSSFDGKSLFIVGGRYDMTSRGIVDRKVRRRRK